MRDHGPEEVPLSLEQLQSFVAVAEEGGVVRASRRLHISQPPLTRRIRGLEDELGAALFVRQHRGMELTSAGRALLPRARAILEEVALLAEVVNRADPPGACPADPPLTRSAGPPVST